jgi:hypothetical protein|tara:strand:- start:97 stop:360 length:264 start_codon:yes stop_codon:yes gene_type:complete
MDPRCQTEEEFQREQLLKDARREKAALKAMKLLINGDNECFAKLTIAYGDKTEITHDFSSSDVFLKAINSEIHEIQKAIDGKPNLWE